MGYRVEHVRYTLECDACGKVEQRDLDKDGSHALEGWQNITIEGRYSRFCCPECTTKVRLILNSKEIAAKIAQKKLEDECEHEYLPRGLLAQCVKCTKWKPPQSPFKTAVETQYGVSEGFGTDDVKTS